MSNPFPAGPRRLRQWRSKDIGIELGAVAVSFILAAIGSAAFKLPWNGFLFFAAFWLANIVVKLTRPTNTVMRDVSWRTLLITCAVTLAAVLLLENPALLGEWTLIVVFGLFLIYGLGSLMVWARSQARTPGERRHGPD